MRAYLLRRVASSLLTVAIVATIVFFASRVLPGDPAVVRAGNDATPELIARINAEQGYDLPIFQQFLNFLTELASGQLGTSIRTGQPVSSELWSLLPATVELAAAALVIGVTVGITAGIVAARWEDRWPDGLVRTLTALGGSMPAFWVSLLGIFVLVYNFGLFPSPVGRLPLGMTPPPTVTGSLVVDGLVAGRPDVAGAAVGQLILPSLILGIISSVPLTRITRTTMISTLHAPHTRAAIGLGLRNRSILFGEGMRNALPTVITSVGLAAGHLLAGSIVVEQIFSWPGIGRYLTTAISYSDFDVVQGYVIVVAIGYIVINFVVDILYSVADPRVKMGGRVS